MGNVTKCSRKPKQSDSQSDLYELVKCEEDNIPTQQKAVHDADKAKLGDLTQYEYPFENLVFEGGGNKGIAYCGCLNVLERLGVLNNTKRLAGASAGAMVAALISVGVSSNELLDYLSQDIGKLMLDHKWGYLSLLPNLIKNYGWNPGKKIDNWFQTVLQKKTGDPNTTFWDGESNKCQLNNVIKLLALCQSLKAIFDYRTRKYQIYKHYGRELCVVVTNVNHMAVEYCHPKTTPHMPVYLAVRMSMSIPVMFIPPIYYTDDGMNMHYVDGGLLCNYPIHCFDGWWLSMAPEHNFLNQLRPLEKLQEFFDKSVRFDTFNEKTLGFLLFADDEPEIMRTHLENRLKETGCFKLCKYPETKLSKSRDGNCDLKRDECAKHKSICKAFDKLVKVIAKHNPNHSNTINRKMFTDVLLDPELNEEDHKLLFDKVITNEDDIKIIFTFLDRNHNDEIEYDELTHFLETKGINVQSRFLGYIGRQINDFPSYISALTETMLTNTKRAYIVEKDKHRTIGVNTGYVSTTDFSLEDEDKEFLIKQGWNSTVAFFREYFKLHENDLKNRPPTAEQRIPYPQIERKQKKKTKVFFKR